MLIIINRYQAELNGLCGGSSVAMVGGIGAFLGRYGFPCCRLSPLEVCARHPAALTVRRQSVVSLSRGLSQLRR
jgi:hypothetical protein